MINSTCYACDGKTLQHEDTTDSVWLYNSCDNLINFVNRGHLLLLSNTQQRVQLGKRSFISKFGI